MSTPNGEKSSGYSGFFHRALSPCSFERLRAEHSDYFYKPKRGPSTSKSNITITRPIKTLETVTKLVELLSKGNSYTKIPHAEDLEAECLPKKLDEQISSSHYSSLLSMDGGDLSSNSSSSFSSRSNSSISTVPEHESQVTVIEEAVSALTQTNKDINSSTISKRNYSSSPYRIPAIGINITMTKIHLVLLELYPQNVDYSTIVFQRHLISLILNHEHKNWSISNVDLRTTMDQEGNFRLFTLTYDEFDFLLKDLQFFIHSNSFIASSFVLNIALTGEQTNEYEMKISSRLNKINLNFDLIQSRAESYMIGLDFFLENNQEEFFDILENQMIENTKQFYPYLLIHAEATSTFFYIVHSANKYSVLTSNNLCYKTYSNLFKLLQPGCDEQMSSSTLCTIRRPPPVSFDFIDQRLSTSLTHIPTRYFSSDYSLSKTSHYIYRGWSNRRTSLYDQDLVLYDAHTQTDDSFLEVSSLQTRLAMHRSLLSMFTMNIALMIKLVLKLYPSIYDCVLVGEFFQLEKQAAQDLTLLVRSILGDKTPRICQLKRESLISALGCALPRVYFDIIDDEGILRNDYIH